jgi:hypothetical protein
MATQPFRCLGEADQAWGVHLPLSFLFDAKAGAVTGSAFLNRLPGMSAAREILPTTRRGTCNDNTEHEAGRGLKAR